MDKAISYLSYAIAKDVPVGVVIANYTSRLSQMFLWNTDTDELTPGQMLKGHAFVQDISHDGRYVVYDAQKHYKYVDSWIGVSRPPYFTALAFIPVASNPIDALFVEARTLQIRAWFSDDPKLQVRGEEIIVAGCPLEIRRSAGVYHELRKPSVDDERHSRVIYSEGTTLFARKGEVTTTIATFPRPEFSGTEAPDWAKEW